MTYKARLIGAAVAASLAATASIALAQSDAAKTQGTEQRASELQATGHMARMAEHCNAMMRGMWQ
jgi:hypothetical protein